MFHAFSQSTQDFLWNIRFNNERSWFLAHKEEYQLHVATPMKELGAHISAVIDDEFPNLDLTLRLSRIYRDARRLHGRGPYKDHIWFSLRHGDNAFSDSPVFFFEIAPEHLTIGLGYYCPTPLTMLKLRTRMDHRPDVIAPLIEAFNADGRFALDGESYKRPKGESSALLAPWYNKKTLALCLDMPWDEDSFSPKLEEQILESFRFLMPYYQYFSTLASDPDPRLP